MGAVKNGLLECPSGVEVDIEVLVGKEPGLRVAPYTQEIFELGVVFDTRLLVNKVENGNCCDNQAGLCVQHRKY